VVAGSNGLEVPDQSLDKIIKGILAKMTGKQAMILVVIFLLLYFSADVAKNWMDQQLALQKQGGEASERIAMSQQETKRVELIVQALTKEPGLRPIEELANESREPLVRGAMTAPRARVIGTAITKEQARAVVAKEREKGKGRRLDGVFEVVEIDVENEDGYMGTLRNVETREEYRVSINRGEVTEEDIETLFRALHDKSAVDALVNAWFVGGKVSHATIVRANGRRSSH
jgi:hypothetical protein